MQIFPLSDKPLAHVLFLKHCSSTNALGHFKDCTQTCLTASMCIQIKASDTEVTRPLVTHPRDLNSEVKI